MGHLNKGEVHTPRRPSSPRGSRVRVGGRRVEGGRGECDIPQPQTSAGRPPRSPEGAGRVSGRLVAGMRCCSMTARVRGLASTEGSSGCMCMLPLGCPTALGGSLYRRGSARHGRPERLAAARLSTVRHGWRGGAGHGGAARGGSPWLALCSARGHSNVQINNEFSLRRFIHFHHIDRRGAVILQGSCPEQPPMCPQFSQYEFKILPKSCQNLSTCDILGDI